MSTNSPYTCCALAQPSLLSQAEYQRLQVLERRYREKARIQIRHGWNIILSKPEKAIPS